MKLLRIKDNSQQKKDVFSQVAKLTGKIADKTLEQLEREGVLSASCTDLICYVRVRAVSTFCNCAGVYSV